MYRQLFVTVIHFWAIEFAQGLELERICASTFNNKTHISTEKDYTIQNTQILTDAGVEKCRKEANSCYTLWTEKKNQLTNTSVQIVIAQGCWESSGKEECDSEVCINDRKPPKALNYTKFCCCSGDLCNSNFTDDGWVEESNLSVKLANFPSAPESFHHETVLVLTVGFFILVIVVAVLIGLYRQWHHMCSPIKPLLSDSVHLLEGGHRSNKGHSVEQLKLSAIVGQGRYGSVWRGTMNDVEIAIKIFPSHYRQYYYNERDIYSLPFMDSPALLKFYGSNKRMSLDNCTEYLLVLSYCSNGSLQDYLRNNTLDLPTFCKMALSVAKGLAHLHTDIRKADKCKPCVCHRDLNTRNILVKADLSCCICDLGLAIKIVGSHYYTLGEEQHAETKSINDVGTLRYMAPEVLEGAVNLRDCESSLKQIDVYALGLVLWELATRCADFYQFGVEVPSYEMPFEAEIGHHPSFEQMQVLVTRNKARPLFPELWRDCAGVRLIRETIEDCWDQDAEARLTSLCVEERLVELTTHSLRGTMYQSGVSPTVNATQTSLPIFSLPTYNNNNHTIDSAEDTGDKEALAVDSTVSEGTVETSLTLSPSEPCAEFMPYVNKNSNNRAQQTVLQPHQGRNPCIERNLMCNINATDDLIDRSMKHHYNCSSDTQNLVSNDYLNIMPRLATPIPFVQNAVSDIDAFQMIPKQPNIPGNGSSSSHIPKQPNIPGNGTSGSHIPKHPNIPGNGSSGSHIPKQPNIPGNGGSGSHIPKQPNVPGNGSSGSHVPKQPNVPGNGSSSSHIPKQPNVPGNGSSSSHIPKQPNVPGNGSSGSHIPKQPNVPGNGSSGSHIPKQPNVPGNGSSGSHISKQPNLTKNGSTGSHFAGILTRPLRTLLDAKKNRSEAKSNVQSNHLKETEVSVDELKAVTALLRKDKENKELALDLQNDISSKISNRMKVIISPFEERSDGTLARKTVERPSKLPLESFKETYVHKKANVNDVFSSGGKEKLKDLTCRIKTPGDVPPSVRRKKGKGIFSQTRFSLYDDRMMEGIDLSKNENKIDLSSQSFPVGIEQSGKQPTNKLDSSF